MNLLIKKIKETAIQMQGKPVSVFFSAGKDAIAAAHIWRQFHKGPQNYVYLYFVDGISFVENTLKYYERLWDIKIDRRPCHETLSLISRRAGGRKYSYADTERAYKEETGTEWILTGMKRADSLARRGMFKELGDSIVDSKRQKIHAVLDWTDKQIYVYCKLNRLPLPITYNFDEMNRSFWVPDTEGLIWLKGNFPKDYKRIITEFPELENFTEKRELGW